MNRYVSILRDHYRALTLPEFIAFVWNAMFKSERTLVYCVSLDAIGTEKPKNRNGRLIVKGSAEDLESARRQIEPVPWEFKCDFYDGVEDFFVYRDPETGKIGHISWLYYQSDPNRTLRLGDKECEIRFCLTVPEFRGRGLYPNALGAIQQHLKGQGYKRCFICANDDNAASMRGIEKAGFRLVGSVRFRKMLGFQVSRRCYTGKLA